MKDKWDRKESRIQRVNRRSHRFLWMTRAEDQVSKVLKRKTKKMMRIYLVISLSNLDPVSFLSKRMKRQMEKTRKMHISGLTMAN